MENPLFKKQIIKWFPQKEKPKNPLGCNMEIVNKLHHQPPVILQTHFENQETHGY